MYIIRKLLLVAFALAFAFVICSCNDPKPKTTFNHSEPIVKEKQERHHNKW